MPSAGQPAARAASARGGGAVTARAASRRSIAASRCGSGADGAGRAPGDRSVVPSRTSRPSRTSPAMSSLPSARAAVRSIVASRRRVRAATARTSSRDASSPTARQDGALGRLDHVRSGDDAGPAVLAVEDAVQVEPRRAGANAIPRGDRGRQARDPFGRLTATRDAPGRDGIDDLPADDPVGPGAPAQDEPVARRDRDRCRQAGGWPPPRHRPGRSRRARSGRRRRRPPRSRGGPGRERDPGSGAARRTRIRSLARTAGSSVRTRPRWRSRPSMPARLSAVRPGPARSTVDPWTWTSRTRTDRSPGTRRSAVPALDRAPAEGAGHDRAATLDREGPVDRQA